MPRIPFSILILALIAIAMGLPHPATAETKDSDSVQIVRNGKTYSIEYQGQKLAVFSPPLLERDADPEEVERLGGNNYRILVDEWLEPKVDISDAGEGWKRVRMTWDLKTPTQQDELSVKFLLTFDPDFHWQPQLTPREGYIVAQHFFRAPAMIFAEGPRHLALLPDIDIVGQSRENPWYMDLNALEGRAEIGMTLNDIPVHVAFTKKPGMTFAPGKIELGFLVHAWDDNDTPANPWRPVLDYYWSNYSTKLLTEGYPLTTPLDRYVEHTYKWVFDHWEDFTWQEFEIDGKKVGAPQFIVNFSQSPNYSPPWTQREWLSIWNQAWFSSLRSASGVARYARRTGNEDLKRRADLTKAFALAAPTDKGIFPSVYGVPNEKKKIGSREVLRPKGWPNAWEHGYWVNSNRTPRKFGISREWYHILDASWTALLMLRWHEDIEKDPELLDYAKNYGDWLLTQQDKDGFFPGWLHPETLEPGPIMNQTPETSMSATFLFKLAELTDQPKYRQAAVRAINAVLDGPAAEGNWLDFETYWSCCRFGQHTHLGKKFERNNQHKVSSFSQFWTAEAALAAYKDTGEKRYLDWGLRTLDELSMHQQVWEPPFIYVPALGGFGVLNFDGEWNDARQTLFAELYMDYYNETGNPELFERGIAALKAGFIMMNAPENPEQNKLYEKVFGHFGEEDYGFTMENYGHGGRTSPTGGGVGSFTIYDWGNGAASEARNRIRDNWGDVYIDLERKQGFGIDSVQVTENANGWELTDMDDTPGAREVLVVFSDGRSETVALDGNALIQ